MQLSRGRCSCGFEILFLQNGVHTAIYAQNVIFLKEKSIFSVQKGKNKITVTTLAPSTGGAHGKASQWQ
jgi:hypothetical protein